MKKAQYGFESFAIKETADLSNIHSHSLPIFTSSAFEFENLDEGISIFSGQKEGYVYGRYGNPTLDAVAEKIATLEGLGTGEHPKAFLTSSGMSAIYLAIICSVDPGKKVLAQYNLYGGTTELLQKVIANQGREVIFTDLKNLDRLEDSLKSDGDISAVYLETPSNPDLSCVDIAAVSSIAKKYDTRVILDNTFATPYLQKGFALGADLVIHSTTKYLNGNGNIIGGIILGKDPEFMGTKVKETYKLLGSMASPFDSWVLNFGIKTLALRMEKHCDNAERLSLELQRHPTVRKVNYPGLESHPDHQIAKKQMARFSGMLSFELKDGLEAGRKMMSEIRFCSFAPTLGNVDTLILHPASSSHLRVPRDIREHMGITDGLVRISVGIETIDDILDDIITALDKVQAK